MVNHFCDKANLRDLIAVTRLVILLKLDSNRRFFSPWELEIWWMTSKKNRAPLPSMNSNWSYSPETLSTGQNLCFLSRMTLKFDRWPWKTRGHLFYTTLSFVHHFKAMGEFKLDLQSGNAQFGSKSVIFLSRAILKFDGWPWRITGHLFYITLSFVYNMKAIDEFKLELQSGNAQFGSKSVLFCPAWPWNFIEDLEKQ